MLLNLQSCTLAGLFPFIIMSSALPFFPHPRDPHLDSLLIPRASYSVVPVDGGAPSPTAGGSPGMTTTIIEIITQSPAIQNTLTIVSTETVPAGTETLTPTATVTAQDTTEIYVVTAAPAAATVTITAGQQTITVTPPIITELPSVTATSSITASTSTGDSSSISILTTITTTPSPVSSTTYDDGFWHTTYPVWSNSSSSATSHVVSSPTSLA